MAHLALDSEFWKRKLKSIKETNMALFGSGEVLEGDEQIVADARLSLLPRNKPDEEDQKSAIKAVIFEMKVIVALLPIGYGKSLIYQVLPALHGIRNEKRTAVVVVTPLNATGPNGTPNGRVNKARSRIPF